MKMNMQDEAVVEAGSGLAIVLSHTQFRTKTYLLNKKYFVVS